MEYEQLERCYKNVMMQRDKFHDMCVTLEARIDLIQEKYDQADSDLTALFKYLPQNQEDGSYPVDGQSLYELQVAIFK